MYGVLRPTSRTSYLRQSQVFVKILHRLYYYTWRCPVRGTLNIPDKKGIWEFDKKYIIEYDQVLPDDPWGVLGSDWSSTGQLSYAIKTQLKAPY